MESCELDLSGLEQKPLTGSCEHANETAGSLKGGTLTTGAQPLASQVWPSLYGVSLVRYCLGDFFNGFLTVHHSVDLNLSPT
jgi:hypothetical protein